VAKGCQPTAITRVKHISQLTKTTVVINYYYYAAQTQTHAHNNIYCGTVICVLYTVIIIGNKIWTTPRKHSIGKIELYYWKFRFRRIGTCIICYTGRGYPAELVSGDYTSWPPPQQLIFFCAIPDIGGKPQCIR